MKDKKRLTKRAETLRDLANQLRMVEAKIAYYQEKRRILLKKIENVTPDGVTQLELF